MSDRAGVAILGRPGGRPTHGEEGLAAHAHPVAILGHPGGRPPPPGRADCRTARRRCDPRSPRRATATVSVNPARAQAALLRSSGHPGGQPPLGSVLDAEATDGRVAILGHPGGRPPRRRPADGARWRRRCDPRSPRRATATSLTPGLRCRSAQVAILGHPGGRPPHRRPEVGCRPDRHVAILGHPGGRPPPPRRGSPGCGARWLRSSVTPEGDRHHVVLAERRHRQMLRSSVTPEGDRHERECARYGLRSLWLRSSVTPEGDRHPPHPSGTHRPGPVAILGHPGGRPPHARTPSRPRPGCSCDPRSPRRATATAGPRSPRHPPGTVAILGHPGGRPPLSAVVGVTTLSAVAILGHPGGRPPRPSGRGRTWGGWGCDPRSPRRATATRVRAARDRPQARCDPRSPRRATATIDPRV